MKITKTLGLPTRFFVCSHRDEDLCNGSICCRWFRVRMKLVSNNNGVRVGGGDGVGIGIDRWW